MSYLKYNSVILEIIDTQEMRRESVLDPTGCQYLYTKWTIDVHAIFNPTATSYKDIPFGSSKGQLPAITDRAIRDRLLQPRKTLILKDGGPDDRTILETPASGYSTDANNGPVPEECTVLAVHGTKTWTVRFRITACVNSCTSVPVVLAHRWKRYTDMDQDYFSMLVTEGEVHFNTARMLADSAYPDDFRRDFFHAIPEDCKREKVEVIPSDDGASLKYRLIDRETAFHLGKITSCTRVEAYQTFWWSKVGFAAGMGGRLVGGAPGVVGGALRAPMGAPVAVGGLAIDGLMAGLTSDMPQFYDHILIRVWGHKESIRRTMMNDIALPLAFSRLGPIDGGKQSELIVTHELHGKFVEVQLTHKRGPELGVLGGIGFIPIPGLAPAVGGILDWRARLGIFNFESEEERAGHLFRRTAVGNPPPPRAAGTRGTLAVRLVTQALHDSCTTPAAVPAITRPVESRWS